MSLIAAFFLLFLAPQPAERPQPVGWELGHAYTVIHGDGYAAFPWLEEGPRS